MSMLGKMIVRRKTMLFVGFLAVLVFATFASGIKAQGCSGPGCGGRPPVVIPDSGISVNPLAGFGSTSGVNPADYTLHISDGWEKGTSTCGPCNDLGKDPGANQTIQNAIGQGMKVDNTGTMPTITDKSGKEVAHGPDEVKKWAEYLKMNDPKAEKDKCLLITPGISKTNDTWMYGEKGVKAKNDMHDFRPVVEARRPIPCPIVAREGKKGPIFSKTDNFGQGDICHWAVDYEGNDATLTESDLNYRIRSKQEEEGIDKFAVTMKTDLDALLPSAKKEIRTGDKQYAGQSNEQINEENARKSGGTITKVPPTGPTKAQHEEYYFQSEQTKRGYTVPAGKKMKAGAPYIINQKGQTDANGKEVEVTKECVFQDPSTKPPTVPDPNNQWPGNRDGSGGGNGGGGGGDEGGGMLDKLLPALMQALQGLKGGGGQGNNSSPTPTPSASPTPYVCPSSTASEKVCGDDGVTYSSQCVAEYENQVTVKHAGICTNEDIATVSSNGVSTLTALLQQLTTSGIPDSLLSSVTNIVTNLITSILSNGGSVSNTVVP